MNLVHGLLDWLGQSEGIAHAALLFFFTAWPVAWLVMFLVWRREAGYSQRWFNKYMEASRDRHRAGMENIRLQAVIRLWEQGIKRREEPKEPPIAALIRQTGDAYTDALNILMGREGEVHRDG